MPLVLLPQVSMAVQSLLITEVPPQLLLTLSENVMVTAPQPSCEMAAPVLLVVVTAGHSRVRSGGTINIGRVVSRTVMNCVPLVLLPQASTASQVRAMNRA